MIIQYHKQFLRDYKKLSKNIKEAFRNRIKTFQENKFNQILNNHKLHEEFSGQRSINITGDIRAIYKECDEIIEFRRIGSHSELYE